MKWSFPDKVRASIRTAMFNEWQRLGNMREEYMMTSLFEEGLDTLVAQGYQVKQVDTESPRLGLSPASLRGHRAQLVTAMKGEVDGEVTLSLKHIKVIAELLGIVEDHLRRL